MAIKRKRPHRNRAAPPRKAATVRAPEKPRGATSEQLADLFDCTTRQIELWAKQGIVVRIARGQYNATLSTRNVVRHLREQAAGRAGVDPSSDTATANRDRAIEQTNLARVKREQLEGKLIDVDVAREVWSRIMRGVRQSVLGLPNSFAHECPTLTATDIAAMKRICADVLSDAATGKGFDLSGLQESEDHDVPGEEPGAGNAGPAAAAAAGETV